MALTPVELPRFSGLDLRDDPQEVGLGAAVDVLNVDLSVPGRLRSRDGYASFSTIPAGYSPIVAKYTYNAVESSPVVVVLSSNATAKLAWTRIYQNGTTLTFDRTGAAGTYGWVANVGSTGVSRCFYSTSGLTDLYYDSAGVVLSVGGGPLAVQSPDNRLVAASGSRVNFSDAGAPTTFGANNWVDLTAGDGETINELVSWGNLLFAFKQTKFFVFYGNSVSSTGTPVFDYRTVNAGQGVRDPQGAVATSEGVYFVNDAGVWLTTGGPPVRISQALDPLFEQRTLPYTSSAVTSIVTGTRLRIANARRQLYVYSSNGTLAWDRTTHVWTAHSIDPVSATGFDTTHSVPTPDGKDDLFFLRAGGDLTTLQRWSSASTTDAGVAIASKYRTGFWNPGTPGTESDIFEWELDGFGSVTVKTAVNDASTLGTGAAVTLGTSPAIAQGRDMRAVWGRNVSLELSGSAPWSVSRVIANVRGQTWPGYKAA